MTNTPNLNLALPDFNNSPWHDAINGNFRAIDATIKSLFGITSLLGAYQNSTAVTTGQRYFDETTGFYYEAQSDFTTMAAPNTFADERTAYPTRWDILDAAEALDAAANAATSAANAATSETNAAASEAAAAASEAAAATSETNAGTSATAAAASAAAASTSEGNAGTSATNAAASASAAATSETNAAASASAAATSKTGADNALSGAQTAQTAAETAETNAEAAETGALAAEASAISAKNAAEAAQTATEAAYDSFDDRYLGAKAADPTLDNDGNALLEGALYWNTASKELKVYNGTAWEVPATVPAAVEPAGKVAWFDRTTAPTGYLKANGAAVSVSTYADLFDAVGYRHTAGTLDEYQAGANSNTTSSAFTFFDRTFSLNNDATVLRLAVYCATARNFTVKIAKRNSAGNYDIVVSEAMTHGGTGWEYHTLATPYVVPSTGDYYVGAYTDASGNRSILDSPISVAYVASDITGTGVSLTEGSSTMWVLGVMYAPTTFAVPDLRGEFIRGLDDGRGVDSGRILGSAQADEFKSHSHDILAGVTTNSSQYVGRHYADSSPTTLSNPIQPTGGSETRPRNVALLACIKY